jgi:hypothetical protein
LDDRRLIRSQELRGFLEGEFQLKPALSDVLAQSGGCRKRFLYFQILESHGHEWQKGDESMKAARREELELQQDLSHQPL